MTLVLQTVQYFYEYTHPKTENWYFANFSPLFWILVVWLYFCLYAGPNLMKSRQPFQLKNTLLVYNFLQVCFSLYLFVEGGRHGWLFKCNWTCQPIEHEDPAVNDAAVHLVWCYLIAKLTELLDTVFFVLRKKDKQITTLHVYHHTIMPLAAWISIRYSPGGHCTFLGWINSFVHIIMYAYYLVAGLGPEYQKFLWWKKHLTSIQLIQFVIIFIHNLIPLCLDCNYPKIFNILICIDTLLFIYMFGKFYYNSYVKTASKKSN